jgi:septum site-determining protein MinD
MTHITEIGGMQGDVVTLQDIFLFNQKGINKQGKIEGEFQATGFIPKFIEVLEKRGYKIPRGLFRNEEPSVKKDLPPAGKRPEPVDKKPPSKNPKQVKKAK